MQYDKLLAHLRLPIEMLDVITLFVTDIADVRSGMKVLCLIDFKGVVCITLAVRKGRGRLVLKSSLQLLQAIEDRPPRWGR